MIPIGSLVARDEHRRAAGGAELVEPRVDGGRAQARAPRTADGCRAARGAPSTRPSAPRPGERSHASAGAAATRAAVGVAAGSPARSDAPTAARPTRRARQSSPRPAPFSGDDVDDLRRAARQRAGLVERDAADAAGPLEVRAAFDQHALPRRAGQRRDDRHRRRDDERARAGDDEQHERAIDPRRARLSANTSGGTMAIGRRERDARPACRRARSARRRSARAPAAPAPARPGG